MSQDLNTALIVFFIGMTTVFTILALVVLTGKILIRTINTFYPAVVQSPEIKTTGVKGPKSISTKKLAAIVAAVENITNGKGSIQSIEPSIEEDSELKKVQYP